MLSWASVYPFDTIKSRMQAARYGAMYKGAPLARAPPRHWRVTRDAWHFP